MSASMEALVYVIGGVLVILAASAWWARVNNALTGWIIWLGCVAVGVLLILVGFGVIPLPTIRE